MGGLDQLPIEIWQYILTIACADGGPTGCALSRVSKTVRAQCRRIRFHALAFKSLAQLEGFLVSIRNSDSATDVATRHLWLSLLDESYPHCGGYGGRGEAPWYLYDAEVMNADPFDESITYRREERIAEMREEWEQSFLSACEQLFDMISSTLRAFTFLQDSEGIYYIPGRLPALEELTLYGNVMAMFNRDADDEEPMDDTSRYTKPRCYPSLKRLHVVSESSDLPSLFDDFPAQTPALTHLRVSGVGEFHDILPKAFEMVFPGVPSRSASVPPTPPAHPTLGQVRRAPQPKLRHLKHVVVQATSPDNANVYLGRRDLLWQDVIQPIHQMSRTAKEKHGIDRFVVLQDEASENYLVDKPLLYKKLLWDDWVDRVEGGIGCWVERAEDIDIEEEAGGATEHAA